MKVENIPCGPFANESEKRAVASLKSNLESLSGNDKWILLSNLSLSINQKGIPDEIDIVLIGPPGVFIIETKHWHKAFLKSHQSTVEAEATKLNNKVRKIVSKVRKVDSEIGFLKGSFLITNDASKFNASARPVVHGAKFFILSEWKEMASVDCGRVLDEQQVDAIARLLEPKIRSTLDGKLHRLGCLINLELVSPTADRFHRVFKGQHTLTRDKVIVHLYDASAFDGKEVEEIISREFTVIQRLQKSAHVPRIMDSYQALPDYPGELFFFSLADPSSPTLQTRVEDQGWSRDSRKIFARSCCQALKELHQHKVDGNIHFVHRNVSPKTVLVGAQNSPIFIGFHLSKTASTATVAAELTPPTEAEDFQAPEVLASGLAAADQRSDVFSLCATLKQLFPSPEPELEDLFALFDLGTSQYPDERPNLDELIKTIDELDDDAEKELPLPEPRYWSEGFVVPFRGRYYRIVSRIGSGSFGATFKVVEYDRSTEEAFGTYLAKILFSPETAVNAINAYRRARAHTNVPTLSTIYDFAESWDPRTFVSLMQWVEGSSLDQWKELIEPYSEELGYTTPQELVLTWLDQACEALGSLHKVGLVHGDISLKNIIESSGKLILTDFDSVQQVGAEEDNPGTLAYCAEFHNVADSGRDIFALAASFFHLIWGSEPFQFGGQFRKDQGLNWEGIEIDGFELVREFLNRATDSDPNQRFGNALDACSWLAQKVQSQKLSSVEDDDDATTDAQILTIDNNFANDRPIAETSDEVLTSNTVDWLREVLKSYPGSQHGNSETRGLDTQFAFDTFVETGLESKLLDDIFSSKVSLVILCGNAGDGKTAFLQHLAIKLGLPKSSSKKRVWRTKVDGRSIVANLDGSASYKKQSSNELLGEIFEPFHAGEPGESVVHLVAINDGRLLEWVNDFEQENGETKLTTWIWETLARETPENLDHIRLIDLNNRSLVGGYDGSSGKFTTGFVDELLNKLTCADRFDEVWSPCKSCAAQNRCTAYRTVSILNNKSIDGKGLTDRAKVVRRRLYTAFQAVHQRGEIHITARELRSALSYIVFGTHQCSDLHENPDLQPESYYDRAFCSESPFRQGGLLEELALFDPSLESHPHIDRHLKSKRPLEDGYPKSYPELSLSSARRRAYFEWKSQEVERIGGQRLGITLARGQHLDLFGRVPSMQEDELVDLRDRLLKGISHLENLPRAVVARAGVTPLKVMPRTPVETCFWIDKQNNKFTLAAEQSDRTQGYETLHRYLSLAYHYDDGNIESLQLNSELFNTLLDLSEGFQLSDAFSADTFAHLSVFTQRLGQEDERTLFAWNPSQERMISELAARPQGGRQQLTLSSSEIEGKRNG